MLTTSDFGLLATYPNELVLVKLDKAGAVLGRNTQIGLDRSRH